MQLVCGPIIMLQGLYPNDSLFPDRQSEPSEALTPLTILNQLDFFCYIYHHLCYLYYLSPVRMYLHNDGQYVSCIAVSLAGGMEPNM